MKKLLIYFVFTVLLSCSTEDNSQNFHFDFLPIQEVELPQSFTYGETYTVNVWYHRPTSCYAFDGVYFNNELNIKTVAIQTQVFEYDNCEDISDDLLTMASFNITISEHENYIFKFWNGVNEFGEDIYLEYDIPVN